MSNLPQYWSSTDSSTNVYPVNLAGYHDKVKTSVPPKNKKPQN